MDRFPLPPKNEYEIIAARFHETQNRVHQEDGRLIPDTLMYGEAKRTGHVMYPNRPFTREQR